jgi:hypothetical protein
MLLAFRANLLVHGRIIRGPAPLRPLGGIGRRIGDETTGLACHVKRLARRAKRKLTGIAKLPLAHFSTKGSNVIARKNAARIDRRPVVAAEPVLATEDVLGITVAENRSLRQALAKIYGEAMLSTEPPAATWYRIAEIADLALAREWPTARS